MIVRQRRPMATKVNVVPMRRRRAGLGDTCTPTNCPSGPYTNYYTGAPDNGANYDYWLQQGTQEGVISTPAQGTDPAVDTGAVSQAMNPSWASYADLQTAVGWELCVGPDVAAQFACSQRNTQRAQQISDIQQQYNGAVPLSVLGSIVPVVAPGSTSAPITSTASQPPPIVDLGPLTSPQKSPVPAGSGTLSFTTSRGGTTLYPGDTWTIRISGAKPNAAISVVGGVNGAMNNTPTGTTDASGNFSLSGTIDSSQVGSWYEAWTVGGLASGTITFTVAATPAAQSGGGTQSGGTQSGGGTQQPVTTTDNWFTDQMISGVPNWALVAAAAGVGLLAFGGKR